MIDSLKFRADILYNFYREMRRTYRALIATAAFFGDAQIATGITRFYRKSTLYFSKHLSKGLPSL